MQLENGDVSRKRVKDTIILYFSSKRPLNWHSKKLHLKRDLPTLISVINVVFSYKVGLILISLTQEKIYKNTLIHGREGVVPHI
jgi:hypothetical protein